MPQISAHIPLLTPLIEEEKMNSDNRPGTASILTPMFGIKNECRTSADVIKRRIIVFAGRTTKLLVSSLWENGLDRSFI